MKVVEEYSSKSLTKERERRCAIGGLAQVVKKAIEDQYLARIQKKDVSESFVSLR